MDLHCCTCSVYKRRTDHPLYTNSTSHNSRKGLVLLGHHSTRFDRHSSKYKSEQAVECICGALHVVADVFVPARGMDFSEKVS
jgi:hypothetical protein